MSRKKGILCEKPAGLSWPQKRTLLIRHEKHTACQEVGGASPSSQNCAQSPRRLFSPGRRLDPIGTPASASAPGLAPPPPPPPSRLCRSRPARASAAALAASAAALAERSAPVSLACVLQRCCLLRCTLASLQGRACSCTGTQAPIGSRHSRRNGIGPPHKPSQGTRRDTCSSGTPRNICLCASSGTVHSVPHTLLRRNVSPRLPREGTPCRVPVPVTPFPRSGP